MLQYYLKDEAYECRLNNETRISKHEGFNFLNIDSDHKKTRTTSRNEQNLK
jgi:hypothetical protein